jgi:hypothetical protein
MKTIKVRVWVEIPDNFTGIVEYLNETKYWLKDRLRHREDGPVVEISNGIKYWYLEGIYCYQINLKKTMLF